MPEPVASDIAGRLLPELFVARLIASYENGISFHASAAAFYRDIGRADAEARARNALDEYVARHATCCIAYEQRFGEIPRLPQGSVDTRLAGDFAAGLAGFPPLPKGRPKSRKPLFTGVPA